MNQESDSEEKKSHRPIRSFVRRQGRITLGQERALEDLFPRFGLTLEQGRMDLEQLFGRQADTILEIGFGDGHSLSAMANAHPEKNYIGIEVHRPGVGSLLLDVEKYELSNVRVFCEDAIEVLSRCIPDESLAGIQLFFPDPWHKKRHHKRRILNTDFVETVEKKLQPGGYFHAATDWENYAEQMMEVLSASTKLSNQAGTEQYMPRPDYRPLTKFENRGQRLGHGVWDLIFTKKATNND